MKTMSLLLSATSMLLATAMPASAATLLYSFTPGNNVSGVSRFSFNVDSNPTVSSSDNSQFVTVVQNLVVGNTARTGTRTFTFFDIVGSDGGLGNSLTGEFSGPKLYSGLTSAPTLLTGAFTLTRGVNFTPVGTLTVSAVAAIPEPATWAMMAVGFGLAASAMRRRKVTTRVSYAANHG